MQHRVSGCGRVAAGLIDVSRGGLGPVLRGGRGVWAGEEIVVDEDAIVAFSKTIQVRACSTPPP
jgi:hypothetical protein